MSRIILGLDIRNDTLAAVIVKGGIRETSVEAFDCVSIPAAEKGESGQNGFSIKPALDALLEKDDAKIKKSDLHGCECMVSFSSSLVSWRNTSTPFKDERKIFQVLPYELESNLPFPVDELVMDFYSIPPNTFADGQKEETRVLAGAVEIQRIGIILDELAEIGLNPEIITPSGYCTALIIGQNWNRKQKQNLPAILMTIDIGDRFCTAALIISGNVCLIRSFPLTISENVNADNLCTNIRRTLAACDSLFSVDVTPDEIWITRYAHPEGEHEKAGNEAKNEAGNKIAEIEGVADKYEIASKTDNRDFLAELRLQIEGKLKISVRCPDLIKECGIKIKMPRDGFPENSGSFFSALAPVLRSTLGVKGFNFRKGPFAIRKKWAEYKSSIIQTGLLAIFLIVFVTADLTVEYRSVKNEGQKLDRQIEAVFKQAFPKAKIVRPVDQMKAAVEELRQKDGLSDQQKNIKVMDIFNEMSRLIPKSIDVELTRLQISLQNILVTGNTDNNDSVVDMQKRVEQSKLFRKVAITSTKKDPVTKRIKFKFKVTL
ncbi:PilN domain-containing protein [Desulfobacterales bacterium HSG16]|nr:PilN domain-containing protein [Desulfobacterales bacterium HSG16]